MILVSFIICVYNGEKYLSRCLESLFRQGLDERELEVICVDDCSKDGSVAILKSFALQHKNVRLIVHEKNLRTGTGCKEALSMASGAFVWVVGQDDWIEDGWGTKLATEMNQLNLDVLLFNYSRVNHDGTKIISRTKVFDNSPIVDGKTFIHDYFEDTFGLYLLGYEWRALFRRSSLMKYEIDFPANVIYEDTTFLFKSIWYSHKIKSIEDFIYNYRLNDTSVTDYKSRYKGYLAYEFSFLTSKELIDFASIIDSYKIADDLRRIAMKSLKSFAYKVVPMSWEEKIIFYRELESHKNENAVLIGLLPIHLRILTKTNFGILLATALKPLFLIKHKFVKRAYVNH